MPDVVRTSSVLTSRLAPTNSETESSWPADGLPRKARRQHVAVVSIHVGNLVSTPSLEEAVCDPARTNVAFGRAQCSQVGKVGRKGQEVVQCLKSFRCI